MRSQRGHPSCGGPHDARAFHDHDGPAGADHDDPAADPARVAANELGYVPFLMHHRLVDAVESEFDMTPAYFRAELERLHREGYHPVRAIDVARRQLSHVPAGRTPVVLTFDDGSPGQFGYGSDGRISPGSAAGILLDFAHRHPGFPAVASYYINHHPFGLDDTAGALRDLTSRGFEIGNHTYDHVDLSALPAGEVEAELGRLAGLVSEAVPGYHPSTMALPFGDDPHPALLAERGAADGTTYRNEAILLVGAEPSHSPWSVRFDPGGVPRIRSSSYGGGTGEFLATWWLDRLAAEPALRYRSAANPGHVTFPKANAFLLDPRYSGRAIAY